ncbi:MAG: hypothetical protein WDW38_002793 [Sanguina aurantia]
MSSALATHAQIRRGMLEVSIPIHPSASPESVAQHTYEAFAQLGRNLTVQSTSDLLSSTMDMRIAPAAHGSSAPIHVRVECALPPSNDLPGARNVAIRKETPFSEQELGAVRKDKVRACGLFAKGYDTAAPSTPQQELTPLHEWRVLTCVAFMQGAVAIPPTGARVGVGREARPRLEVRVLPGAASRVWCRPASGTRVLAAAQVTGRDGDGDRGVGRGRSQRLTPAGVSSEVESALQEMLQAGVVFGGGIAALGDFFESLDRILSSGGHGPEDASPLPQPDNAAQPGELMLPPHQLQRQQQPQAAAAGGVLPVGGSSRAREERAAASRCVAAGHEWPSVEAAAAVKQLLAIGAQVIPPGGKGSFEWGVLAGYETEKRKIEDCVLLPLLHPHVYERVAQSTRLQYESNRPRAVLFEGPPGTGKTTSARVISTQAAVPLVCVPLEALLSKWYGDSEKQLSQVFRAAEALGGCILFLDELDALGGSRDSDMHEASRRVLSVLLREMEGFDVTNTGRRAIVIGATNRKADLDAALISRFDMVVTFGLPDEQCRGLILKRYARQLADADVEELARRTGGLSGRDLRDVCDHTERVWAAKIIRGEAGEDTLPQIEEYVSSSEQRLQHTDA